MLSSRGIDELDEHLSVQDMVHLVRTALDDPEIAPSRVRLLVDFAYVLGYAPMLLPEWKMSSGGLFPEQNIVDGLSRRAVALSDYGKESCALLYASGVPVTPSDYAHPLLRRQSLNLTSSVERRDIYAILNNHTRPEVRSIIVPCGAIKVGNRRLDWAPVTVENDYFLVDGEELGGPPWDFLAVAIGPFREIVELVRDQEILVKAYLNLISEYAEKELAWCFYRLPEKGRQVSLNRARELLLERICEDAGLQDLEVKRFIVRAWEIEEMLNPAFVHEIRDILTGDDKLRDAVQSDITIKTTILLSNDIIISGSG